MKGYYKAKTLIPGYKVSFKFIGKTLIAIPENKFVGEYVVAGIGNKPRLFYRKDCVYQATFQDKFGRKKDYKLLYFIWED